MNYRTHKKKKKYTVVKSELKGWKWVLIDRHKTVLAKSLQTAPLERLKMALGG